MIQNASVFYLQAFDLRMHDLKILTLGGYFRIHFSDLRHNQIKVALTCFKVALMLVSRLYQATYRQSQVNDRICVLLDLFLMLLCYLYQAADYLSQVNDPICVLLDLFLMLLCCLYQATDHLSQVNDPICVLLNDRLYPV